MSLVTFTQFLINFERYHYSMLALTLIVTVIVIVSMFSRVLYDVSWIFWSGFTVITIITTLVVAIFIPIKIVCVGCYSTVMRHTGRVYSLLRFLLEKTHFAFTQLVDP